MSAEVSAASAQPVRDPVGNPVPSPGFTDAFTNASSRLEEPAPQRAAIDDDAEGRSLRSAALRGDDFSARGGSERLDDDKASDPFDDGVSPFEHRPPFRPRRNPLKIWTAAGAIFALLAFGGIFAVSYYGFPDWIPVSRPIFAVAEPDLVLDFPADQQDRRTLADGSEFFSASGSITNVGRKTRTLPSILIIMRNEREVPVYSWVLAPPERSLAPGESVTINEIATDVPKNAKYAEIGWSPT